MSDMIINDSVPVDKKWNELIKYNIFIMKLVEFAAAAGLMFVPFFTFDFEGDVDTAHNSSSYICLVAAPTLVLSTMFIILYLVDQVHDLAEQLYLTVQIAVCILAYLVTFLLETPLAAIYGIFFIHMLVILGLDLYFVVKERGSYVVVALLLNILPHVVEPVGTLDFHCFVASPTLMCSMFFMLLYVVDQVQFQAEFYYACIQIFLTIIAMLHLMTNYRISGAIYLLFYIELLIALSLDMYYQKKERGWTF